MKFKRQSKSNRVLGAKRGLSVKTAVNAGNKYVCKQACTQHGGNEATCNHICTTC